MFIEGTDNQGLLARTTGEPSVKIVKGKPAIAFTVTDKDDGTFTSYTKLALATYETPQYPEDWTFSKVGLSTQYPFMHAKLVVVDTNPIVTYSLMTSVFGTKQVRIGYGTEITGGYSWNNEYLDTSLGNHSAMPIVTDNTLAIVYNSYTENTLRYATNAAWKIHTAVQNVNSTYNSTTLLNGKPAMVYCAKIGPVTYLKFKRALVNNPIQDIDWVEMDVDSSNMVPITLGAFSHPSIKILDGKPCISYGQDAATPILKYARAIINEPLTTNDWVKMNVSTDRVSCTATSLDFTAKFSLVGLPTYYPVIAYQTTTGIGFAYSTVASPSYPLDWSSYPILTVPNGTAPSIAIYKVSTFVVGPIISYFDSIDNRVYTIKSEIPRPANTLAWNAPVPLTPYSIVGVVNPNHAITTIKCSKDSGYPIVCYQIPTMTDVRICLAQAIIEKPLATSDWFDYGITTAYGTGYTIPEPPAMSFNLVAQGAGNVIGFSYRNFEQRIAYCSNTIPSTGSIQPGTWKFETVRPDLYPKNGIFNSLTYISGKPAITFTLDNPNPGTSIRFAQKQ